MADARVDPNLVRFFSGSSNRALARGIADHLGIPLAPTETKCFSNENLYIQLGASVRGRTVFVVQSLSPAVQDPEAVADPHCKYEPRSINDYLVELLMMLDIARAAGAQEIHAIIPYYSFARSDKKDAPRICITARLVADLLKTAGATHVMTMMLHSPQVHGFFSVPTDPLTSRPVFETHFRARNLSDTIVVAPDMGHAKSAARFARDLELPVAAGNKERLSDERVRITGIAGDQIRGCERAIIYDDEIATGGSVLELTDLLVARGIREISVACTHGVFTRGALDRLAARPEITEIVTTDTVYTPSALRPKKLTVLSVAEIFGKAICSNCNRKPIGDLLVFADDSRPAIE